MNLESIFAVSKCLDQTPGGLRVWRRLCQHSLDSFTPGETRKKLYYQGERSLYIITKDARAGEQEPVPGPRPHAPLLLQAIGESLVSRENKECHQTVLHISLYSGKLKNLKKG